MNRIYKILNVDDDEAGRYMVNRILHHAGFEVIEAATGYSALSLLEQKPDLVLLDINLPDISGYEVCRQIKQNPKTKSIIIVHLTASRVASSNKVFGLESGADAYLTEPLDANELVATVRAMIRIKQAEEKAIELASSLENKILELEKQRQLREQFVNGISHDLRGPLTTAKMSAQLIERSAEATESTKLHSARIIGNIGRIDQMIQNLLDANRINAGEDLPLHLDMCDLDSIITKVVAELSSLYNRRFEVKGNSRITGFWDCEMMHRVIENLCGNACKYGAADEPITILVADENQSVKVSIHNKGPAIPEKELDSIFEPFHRSSSAISGNQKGWGIGLTLVRGIISSHGGKVTVESSNKTGTTFTIEIPVRSEPRQNLLPQ